VAPVGKHGDMFLWLKSAKSGLVKGESADSAHPEEIEVVSWSWGMQARTSMGGSVATGKAAILELKITKRLDSASTALMAALRHNEPIAKAVLTVRKAGKHPLEHLKITIEQGRVTGLTIEGGEGADGTETVERLSLTFNKLNVEYKPQGPDGQPRGSMMFADEFHEQS
jgi:type VI secretion system secreted protein Hcp